MNKIEKEVEIHARKTIKVPINAHTILLNTNSHDELPIVHKSGQNSPKHPNSNDSNEISGNNTSNENNSIENASHNQLLSTNDIHRLDEKLLVASVSLASTSSTKFNRDNGSGIMNNSTQLHSNDAESINETILKSDILSRNTYRDNKQYDDNASGDSDDETIYTNPLLSNEANAANRRVPRSGPHAIRGAPRNDFTCSGSDCDISWICLLICILALCFAIPLIYVIYIAEHPEQFNHKDSEAFNVG